MWVNILDSLLSSLLIIFLIPRMGIGGYALVIVIMEGFNFALSYIRLRKRLIFKVDLISSFVLPLCLAMLSAALTKRLFAFPGGGASIFCLVSKLVFSVCGFLCPYIVIRFLFKSKSGKGAGSVFKRVDGGGDSSAS